jgi:hypothetical protein
VRLLLPSLRVLCSDFTFATCTGQAHIVGSNGSTRTDYDCALYGFAQGSCGPAAHARIDLRGTPFAVDARFQGSGCSPRASAAHSCGGQLVLLAGTGCQGACAPTHPGERGEDAAVQYPCLGDGHARQLWARSFGHNAGRPFELQVGQ